MVRVADFPPHKSTNVRLIVAEEIEKPPAKGRLDRLLEMLGLGPWEELQLNLREEDILADLHYGRDDE